MTQRWIDVLSTAECHDFLARESLGRVAVSIGALPVILPVFYVSRERSIWFFTEDGTKLNAAVNNSIVAFEVDRVDEAGGWSVLVVGRCEEEHNGETIRQRRADGLADIVPGVRDHLIRVPLQQVSGRRFRTDGMLADRTGYA